ncbi:MAG: type II toxin-antitoxin system VapC family toxin [Nitrospirae bacterium]|nr:type II toxin-antitoxin system VapC family toxin [Nitrospirota bacterium]MBI3352701.1 type II toxin-antitoxin system VapC family toxin [Nitrospirota bacterium]
MKNIVLDTDILINFLRGREKARTFLSSLIDEATLHCSVITIAEIFAGMREQERKKTEELLDSLNIIEITKEIAEKAGSYKNRIKSQNLELDDCLIAASAQSIDAILATGNTKHYPMTDIKKMAVSDHND